MRTMVKGGLGLLAGLWCLGAVAQVPLGLPPSQPVATEEVVALGRTLFFDRRLSVNATLSCGNCHVAAMGFSHREMATSVGIEGRAGRRNAPGLFNVAYLPALFWDGRSADLEAQIWSPLLADNEMGNSSRAQVLARLATLDDYPQRFERAFGRGIDEQTLGQALAAYLRSLLLGNSPFDRWFYRQEQDALSAKARAGYRVFVTRAGCHRCHQLGLEWALFTDHRYHNTGAGAGARAQQRVQLAPGLATTVGDLASVGGAAEADDGRAEVTGLASDVGRFRTPSLRNLTLTAPYMHDGSLATLEAVVAFYNRGGGAHPNKDPLLVPLNLSTEEQAQLVAFLESLTGRGAEALVAEAEATAVGNP
ncbi:cytochrome-c peroxidase [Ferrimonas balearica]|uniref:cytochrome-c peroxidase n=1 Tax=Ferrimonas balearica TaxID=44012 RepID=UPI0028F726D9|nr:cytochrome c peroxidase [Ferrimonas balearica]